jgi:hypothetical protein
MRVFKSVLRRCLISGLTWRTRSLRSFFRPAQGRCRLMVRLSGVSSVRVCMPTSPVSPQTSVRRGCFVMRPLCARPASETSSAATAARSAARLSPTARAIRALPIQTTTPALSVATTPSARPAKSAPTAPALTLATAARRLTSVWRPTLHVRRHATAQSAAPTATVGVVSAT